MSHKAAHWLASLPASAMTGGQFRVLFHLCDAHNAQRDPETACFPSQERLREATGLSNGGLNDALNGLERAGLIRRKRRRNADGTLGPTFYILGFDLGEAQEPSPETGGGPISSLGGSPSPVSGPHHLQSTGDKPVIEPGKEPRARKSRVSARDDGGSFAEKQVAQVVASDPVDQLADWINSGARVPPSAVSNTHRDALLARGLVTRDQLRALQIY